MTNEPGWSYFVVYLAATTPLGVVAAVAAWLPSAIGATLRAVAAGQFAPARTHVIVFAWFAIPLLGMVVSPVRQDGVRYVMPCVTALAMMAAAGIDFVARALPLRRRHRTFDALSVAIVFYLALALARSAPYYLDYFNEVAGPAGKIAAHSTFEVGWWGEGLGPAIEYVNEHAARGAIVDRSCIDPQHLAWFREDLWDSLAASPKFAKWIVVYGSHPRGCVLPLPRDARRVFAVTFDGADLAVVYRRP
jgi:hypothetical protein